MGRLEALDDQLVLDIFIRATRDGSEGTSSGNDLADARAETYGKSEDALDFALNHRFGPLAIAAALRTITIGSATQMDCLLQHLRSHPDQAVHIRGISLSHHFIGEPRPRMYQLASLLRLARCLVAISIDMPGTEFGELVDALGDSLRHSRVSYISLMTTDWTAAPASLSFDILRFLATITGSLRWLVLHSAGQEVSPVFPLSLPALEAMHCHSVSSMALIIANASPKLRSLSYQSNSTLRDEHARVVRGLTDSSTRSLAHMSLAYPRGHGHQFASMDRFTALRSLRIKSVPIEVIRALPPTLRELDVYLGPPASDALIVLTDLTWLPDLHTLVWTIARRQDTITKKERKAVRDAAVARGVVVTLN